MQRVGACNSHVVQGSTVICILMICVLFYICVLNVNKKVTLKKKRNDVQITIITSNDHRKMSYDRKDQQEIYLKDNIRSRKGKLLTTVIKTNSCPALDMYHH